MASREMATKQHHQHSATNFFLDGQLETLMAFLSKSALTKPPGHISTLRQSHVLFQDVSRAMPIFFDVIRVRVSPAHVHAEIEL
jgi:hypothetical protein